MLFETIRIHNGSIQHLSYHQARFDSSRAALFPDEAKDIDLASIIHPPTGSGILKCRIRYGREVTDIDYSPYIPREIRRLKIVHSSIGYAHKFSDRRELDELFEKRGDADEILIVRDGFVTDTSIANIAFFNGRTWVTPKRPLLRGTTRERLIRSGFLVPRDIRVDEIRGFDRFALLNAMIGFEPVESGIITE
ncbi:aminodeoxychorismate lyase [Hydrogenimonas sp.]|nr:aminodeoxychorismate lyase [Hydrogenimonas sp.]